MKDYTKYLNYLYDFKHGKIDDGFIDSYNFFNHCNLKNNNLVFIAGRTGIGKSTLALNLVNKIIKENQDLKIVYYSLEMNKTEIFHKLTALTNSIPLVTIMTKNGIISDAQYDEIRKKMAIYEHRLKIIDCIYDFKDIVINIKNLKEQDPQLKVVFIDYLGLSIGFESDRYLQFGKATRILHQLSKDLNICIICLHQLNRHAAETTPELIHLRDSGSIEQDAEQVYLISENNKHDLEVRIAKNRYGINNIKGVFNFIKAMAILEELPEHEPSNDV